MFTLTTKLAEKMDDDMTSGLKICCHFVLKEKSNLKHLHL